MEKSLFEEARENLAEFTKRVSAELGDPEELKVLQEEVKELTGADRVGLQSDSGIISMAREGYLCRIHVGRTRFTAKLRPKDVGLDPENPAHKEFVLRYISLGDKFLLPGEILRNLDRIEKQMRRAVDEQFGVPTCMGSFVPYKNIPLLKSRLEELKAEYFSVRDEILERYDQLQEATAEAYRAFALEVYRLLRKDPDYLPTHEEVQQFVDATMAHFPSESYISSSFYVTVVWDVIAFTAKLAEHEARLRLVRERERLYREELELIERKLTEENRVQQERERQAIRLEQERVKTKIMQEQAKRRAIEEAIAQAQSEYLPQMEQVFADLTGAVHGIVYDAVTKATESLKTHGALRPSDSKSLANLLERVRTLALNPDSDVERWMAQIQAVLDTPAKKRDYVSCREALDEIRAEAGKAILSLGRVPRTVRNLDLPDIESALEEIEEIKVGVRQVRPQVTINDVIGDGGEATPLLRSPRPLEVSESA